MIFRAPANAISLFIIVGISLIVSFISFKRRRNNPSAAILAALMLTSAFWTLGYILELSVVPERAQFIANDLAYIPIIAAPIVLMSFILAATGNLNYLTPPRLLLILIIPMVNLVLIWTSRHHNLFYSWILWVPEGDRNVMTIGRGFFYWVNIVYSYLCMLTATLFAFASLIRSKGVFRTRAILLSIGIILPWAGSLIDIFYGDIAGIHAMQASFVICGIIFTAGIIKFSFADISPIGRHILIEKMDELMLAVDKNGFVVDLNPALVKYIEKPSSEILGKHATEAFREWAVDLDKIMKTTEDSIEISIKKKGESFFRVSKTRLLTKKGVRQGTLIVMTDITARVTAENKLKAQLTKIKNLEQELREQSIRDPLTGLYNRRFLEEVMNQYFARAKRGSASIDILFIDIDDFKILNDTQGHLAGDRVLKNIGRILLSNIRESDIACRYGGEEFLIVFLDSDSNEIFQRAEKMRKEFESQSATFSGGIASYSDACESVGELINKADEALYKAKAEGKNKIIASQ